MSEDPYATEPAATETGETAAPVSTVDRWMAVTHPHSSLTVTHLDGLTVGTRLQLVPADKVEEVRAAAVREGVRLREADRNVDEE